MPDRKYGADSPANSYLRPKANDANLPAPTDSSRAVAPGNDPRMREFIQFVADNENGNPRAIAEAILLNRGQILQQRRDLINFARGLIRLPPREIAPETRIVDLTRQFTRLFKEHEVMLKSRSASLDAAIEVRTKSLDYEHTVAKKEADIAEEEARKTKALVDAAKADRELRRIQGAADPDDARTNRREDDTDRYREALREIKLREKQAEVAKKEAETAEIEARLRANRTKTRPSLSAQAKDKVRKLNEEVESLTIIEDGEQQARQRLVRQYGEDSDVVKRFDRERKARHIADLERR